MNAATRSRADRDRRSSPLSMTRQQPLLRTCFLHADDGAEITIPRIVAAQQWALRVAFEAGLTISPGGPLIIRNHAAATSPYLPDNAFC
jgi:hypothetical protein